MKWIIAGIIIFINSLAFTQDNQSDVWVDIFEFLEKNIGTDGLNRNYEYLAGEVFKNGIGKSELNIGLEHLRVDELKEKIVNKKSEYPIPNIKNKLVHNKLIRPVGIDMFARLFEIPIKSIFVNDKSSEFSDKQQAESFYTIGLIIIPVDKNEDSYTFRLSFLTAIKLYGEYTSVWFRGQNIKMHKGEKIKIEIDHNTVGQHVDINKGKDDSLKKNTQLFGMYGMHRSIHSSDDYWKVSPEINGKIVEFSSEDEFFKGVKDYLILSFEDVNE